MRPIPSGSQWCRRTSALAAAVLSWSAAVLAAGVLSGCPPTQTTVSPVASASTNVSASTSAGTAALPPKPLDFPFPTRPGERHFARVKLKRFDLSISIPDPAGWKVRRERSRFALLDHPETASSLVLRLWLESENMSRKRCEERARLWRDLPKRGQAISNRSIDVPRGFDTQVDVGFSASKPGEPLTGYVMAFGAWARRCFAFAYTTSATGADAEQKIGDRLALVQGRTLEAMRVQRATDLDADRRRRP